MLFLFNLIPVPPLDGSHILKNMINMKAETYYKFYKYGFIILQLLINFPFFKSVMGKSIMILNGAFFSIFSQIIN